MKKKILTILVTGGSGYIGSHVVKKLLKEGMRVVCIDVDKPQIQEKTKDFIFIQGNIGDKKILTTLFKKYHIDVVIHLAAFIRVDESMEKPDIYFKNNVTDALVLLEAMRSAKVRAIIFASSAAVYGASNNINIDEDFLKQPSSVYGLTKYLFENILDFYNKQYGFSAVSLRIFNAAGADASGNIQERHKPETHIIPNIITSLYAKKPIIIYGNDYPTKDGTCERDYVHVSDIAEAFFLAISYVSQNTKTDCFNIGFAKGYSLKEVLATCFEISGKKTRVIYKKRRAGDYPSLISDNNKAKSLLKWQPKYQIQDIVSDTIHSQ